MELQIIHSLDDLITFGIPSGIIFIDIDHFKNINDEYGHETGDYVLKTVAQTLLRSIRDHDFAARWGGEEFVVLLKNIEPDHVIVVSEKLRIITKANLLRINGNEIGVTISCGATRLLVDDTLESVIHRADQLMYQSKSNGRNKLTTDIQ